MSAEGLVQTVPRLSPPKLTWVNQGNIILVTGLVSDGTAGRAWISRLMSGGFHVHEYAREVLISPEFVPTCDVEYEATIVRGSCISADGRNLSTTAIREAALSLGLFNKTGGVNRTHPEVACLMRLGLSDEELKELKLCWIDVMHEPIANSRGEPGLLEVDAWGGTRNQLYAACGRPDSIHGSVGGYAFVTRIVEPKTLLPLPPSSSQDPVSAESAPIS